MSIDWGQRHPDAKNAYVGQRCAIRLALRQQPFYIQDLSPPCLATLNLLPADVLYCRLGSAEVAGEEKASGWQMFQDLSPPCY